MSNAEHLGTCCACQKPGKRTRNVVMLNFRTPYGFGWSCFQCGLPAEGAIAVICDECLDAAAEIKDFVKGDVLLGQRAPMSELKEPFEHDMSKHPSEDPLDEDEAEDPVVLYDPETGAVTDSELRLICEQVSLISDEDLPPYWRNELSGELAAAIEAYINHGADPSAFVPPTPEQIQKIAKYLSIHINASCWADCDGKLEDLRRRAPTLDTIAEIDQWLEDCLDIGIDPL